MSVRRPAHVRRQASVDYPRYAPLNSTTQQPPPQLEMVSQAILPSDYESDNQGYASDYPGLSTPTTRSKDELNLSVLRKCNPEVVNIISIAPYVTIYEFAATANEWQKSGLVGTLFICQLCPGQFGEDRYRAIVLNRSGLENYEAELRQSYRGGVSMSGDYVEITREDPESGETKVNAIYIYSEENTSTAGSRKGNGELMVALANAAKLSREAAESQAFLPVREVAQSQPPVPALSLPALHTISQPKSEVEHAYLPTHYSPEPSITPAPATQVDLLALLRGHQSGAHSVAPRPPDQTQSVNVMDLFRKSGAF